VGHRQRAEVLGAALEGRGGRGRAYPEALRRRAVAYFHERRVEGAAVADIGPEIGLSWRTLVRWEREMRGQDEPSPAFELVHVESSSPTASWQGFVVHGPAGLRVEGLDMDGLCQFATSRGQQTPDFSRVMGPPSKQHHGATRGGGLTDSKQGHGATSDRISAGSWGQPAGGATVLYDPLVDDGAGRRRQEANVTPRPAPFCGRP
jgi:hypothetical protein